MGATISVRKMRSVPSIAREIALAEFVAWTMPQQWSSDLTIFGDVTPAVRAEAF